MREYQRTYLENLQKIVSLNDLSRNMPEDGAAFLRQRREHTGRIREIVVEDNVMLRKRLFPVMDNIASADGEDIEALEDFAGHLGAGGANQVDLVLHYTIRCALVSYARKWGKRDMLIRELYHAGLALFYMQEIIDRCAKVRYRWKMGLLFGEAASYIKQYDEIGDVGTRGYIHRSMGNLSLAYGGANREDAEKKLNAVRRSLQILNDPVYQAKTPELPWETYIYVSHQERSSALNVLRAGISDPVVLKEVMESTQFVREYQDLDCQRRGVKPMVRWRMGYEAAQFHCGIQPLGSLLRWLEEAYMQRDERDYSEDGIYANISLPALYAEYLSHNEEYRVKKKEVLSHMYRRVAQYVRGAPEEEARGILTKYLLLFLESFVEYPDGIQEKDFLLQLVVCRHPDAYVRFRLTAQIMQLMTVRALESQPELLVGVLGCRDVKEVMARGEELLQFAYDSGLLHDVGVLAFNDMMVKLGRGWMEEEREMVQYHVYAGEYLLGRSPSTRPFARTALGHHRFYDGSGGYPADYVRSGNAEQTITDMVSVASYLTHVTDDTDPQNWQPVTLERAVELVRQNAGTRFSPEAAGLLDGLEDCLQAGRTVAYEDAFRILKG